MHAHLYINGSSVMMSDAYPEHGHPYGPAAGFSLMLMVAIAGREAARELNVFQIMEIRSVLGLLLLYPLIRLAACDGCERCAFRVFEA